MFGSNFHRWESYSGYYVSTLGNILTHTTWSPIDPMHVYYLSFLRLWNAKIPFLNSTNSFFITFTVRDQASTSLWSKNLFTRSLHLGAVLFSIQMKIFCSRWEQIIYIHVIPSIQTGVPYGTKICLLECSSLDGYLEKLQRVSIIGKTRIKLQLLKVKKDGKVLKTS